MSLQITTKSYGHDGIKEEKEQGIFLHSIPEFKAFVQSSSQEPSPMEVDRLCSKLKEGLHVILCLRLDLLLARGRTIIPPRIVASLCIENEPIMYHPPTWHISFSRFRVGRVEDFAKIRRLLHRLRFDREFQEMAETLCSSCTDVDHSFDGRGSVVTTGMERRRWGKHMYLKIENQSEEWLRKLGDAILQRLRRYQEEEMAMYGTGSGGIKLDDKSETPHVTIAWLEDQKSVLGSVKSSPLGILNGKTPVSWKPHTMDLCAEDAISMITFDVSGTAGWASWGGGGEKVARDGGVWDRYLHVEPGLTKHKESSNRCDDASQV
mmetsp:Transcript_20692/g.40056  ORF Transcript_20692/g.40056 Transcript_20692/m.40056 type:complete len:321 (+) Transcript_20692:113-1075(+)